MAQVERLARCVVAFPRVPRTHQRVLEYRELVGVRSGVGQHARDELRRDALALAPHGLFDRSLQLLARETRHEEHAVVDRFGEAAELRAVADEVRAQRDRDVHRQIRPCRRRQQQLHERRGVARLRGGIRVGRVAEQLFELVHHDEQTFVVAQLRRGDEIDEAALAALQRAEHPRARQVGIVRLLAEHLRPREHRSERFERRRSGPHRCDAPRRTGAFERAALEGGDDAGEHQRRLTAARRAHHRQEARRAQALQHRRDLRFAPEEHVGVRDAERSQADERVVARDQLAGVDEAQVSVKCSSPIFEIVVRTRSPGLSQTCLSFG